jgi:hypothetical protein
MALTGTLLADFSAFVNESAKATTAVKGMESSADTAATKLSQLAPAATETGTAFSGLSTQIAATFTGMVSSEAIIGATSAAFHTLTEFVSESVAAYSKQEDATVQLTAALRQHGLATPEVISQYNALATTFQNTTKYADEDIQAMEKLLTLVGNVMPSQMQAALKASTDLASGLGIGLEQATNLVAKAAAGHTTALGRYGITVNEADVASRGFAAVLDVINEKFGGQAAAAIETYSGRVAQAANAWDNVKEALGKVILEDPLVTNALNHMVDATKAADTAATAATPSLAGLAADFGLIDRNTAQAIDGLEAYVDGLNTAAQATRIINALPSPFEKMAKDGALPAINTGLDLNNKLVKEHEEQIRKDAEAAKEWAKANDAVNGSLVTWQDTLATVDKGLQEDIKIALSSGVSQKELATAWGLTDAQIKAVVISLGDYATALNITADLEKDEIARRKEITAITLKATNDRVLAELQAKQAAEAANEAFLTGALKDAQAQDALQQGISATASASTTAAETIGSSYEQGFTRSTAASSKFRNSATADATAVAAAAAAATAVYETVQGRYDAFQAQQAANPSNILSQVGMFGGMQYVQTRDSGGPVVAGQSYLIGGGKAPEIFTPGASGFVTPGGAGGGSHVTQNIYITQPLGTADAIARAVADAQVNLMRGQGVRLPYGT